MAGTNGLGTDRARVTSTHSNTNSASAQGRFPAEELEVLRNDLQQSGVDSWQAAELLSAFLATRGYGVSSAAARHALERIEEVNFEADTIRTELEKMALVM